MVCTACGKAGHTVMTCQSKAAAVIRKLKAKCKTRAPRRKPGRATSKRVGKDREQGKKRYTMKPGGRLKLIRKVSVKE